jgi:hypothetical protein
MSEHNARNGSVTAPITVLPPFQGHWPFESAAPRRKHHVHYWAGACVHCGALAAEIERNPSLRCLDVADKAHREFRLRSGLDAPPERTKQALEGIRRAVARGRA